VYEFNITYTGSLNYKNLNREYKKLKFVIFGANHGNSIHLDMFNSFDPGGILYHNIAIITSYIAAPKVIEAFTVSGQIGTLILDKAQ
jgi:hypothetical protein